MTAIRAETDATHEPVDRFLRQLSATLIERGVAAEPLGTRMVVAKNVPAEPPDGNLRAKNPTRRFRQAVMCQRDDAGRLAWFWVCTGPLHDGPGQLEYLCPAEHVGLAADRIARVLDVKADSEPTT